MVFSTSKLNNEQNKLWYQFKLQNFLTKGNLEACDYTDYIRLSYTYNLINSYSITLFTPEKLFTRAYNLQKSKQHLEKNKNFSSKA